MAFAENLRRFRLERFLSQAELARQASIHPITITRLEAGDQAPTTRTVRTLAGVLGLEPHELASPGEVAAARMLGRRRRTVSVRVAAADEPSSSGPPRDEGESR